MIIDCHGHYTTEPKGLKSFREQQVAAVKNKARCRRAPAFKVSDDDIRETIEKNQLKKQQERGTDITIFSPRAAGMGHHIGDETQPGMDASLERDDLSASRCSRRISSASCQLPQSPASPPKNSATELERCVKEYGFVGCNLNPDPSGGHLNSPPLTDKRWYPIYEKLCELDVPAMVHVSLSATRRSTPPARTTSTPTPRRSCSSSCPTCSRTSRSCA